MKQYEVTVMRKMLYRGIIIAENQIEAEAEMVEAVENGEAAPLDPRTEAELIRTVEVKPPEDG